ncbi:GntR family transcriptional regulator [Thorsellia anophelis]|uniref:GntR family transcriptional regulator, mannosyl-D-glycerate transport/metabolism system repressor n=1 Tax=Thorsellia anophelis DSM 18579 TaxID=1123402 RepID=A0A1H9YEQ3_9GAMM|nr:GntR family transcriptional regulator [Thorsellia anophelis]SES67492.1 GntR family transcriptional regulator, mannosyl-D-glycerate transport/metabolism system repressor [Thorsellia anophelis DSM 18579]
MAKQPMYRVIANSIKEQIKRGELAPGDAIFTEAELCNIFSVSRVTVRQAIKNLIEERVLESIQGSGTYVKKALVDYDIYQMTGFEEKFDTSSQHTHSEILKFEIIKPNKNITNTLQLTEEDKVYYVKRVRFIDKKAITLEETWLPLKLFPDLTYEIMQGSKYHYIEQIKKLVIDRSEQEILAVMPREDVCTHLDIPIEQPIIEKITIGYLESGVIFEYSRNFFKSSEYKFTLTAKRKSLR